MAEHNHSKVLTFRERSDAIMLRATLSQVRYRFDMAHQDFIRSHGSGYCAFEMLKHLSQMTEQLDILVRLIKELGELEHYNFETILAQAEEGS